MKLKKINISYESTNRFSNLVIDYINQAEKLKPFIQSFPSKDAILDQIENRNKNEIKRELLHDVLLQQYQKCKQHDEVSANIAKLKLTNCFTICTAHQPSIFTGQLYFIYKIVHAIKLAAECSTLYPTYHFVPIFYMGSEDNDIDEIGTFHYNEETFSWKTKQTGACGRMNTGDLANILNEIKLTLNEQIDDEKFIIQLFEQAYNEKNTLAEATRILIHALFGKFGLVVIDGDDMNLKRQFAPIMQQELLEQNALPIVSASIAQLSNSYKVQANPRSINLFYLKDDMRERIEIINGKWQVVNTNISFTKEEILFEVTNYPERFSPNVILRPLYQESILPNLAFIGGGGELAYWLELKSLFDFHHIAYPLLFLRNSVLWMDKKTITKLKSLNLSQQDIFKSQQDLFNQIIYINDEMQALSKLQQKLNMNYEEIIKLGENVSDGLGRSMKAHQAKAKRIEDRIVQKFKAQIKKKESDTLNKIQFIQHKIFPNGTLQERYDNFLSIYKVYGLNMFDDLMASQEAFGNEFIILSPSEEN